MYVLKTRAVGWNFRENTSPTSGFKCWKTLTLTYSNYHMVQWKMGVSPIWPFPFIWRVIFHWTMIMGERVSKSLAWFHPLRVFFVAIHPENMTRNHSSCKKTRRIFPISGAKMERKKRWEDTKSDFSAKAQWWTFGCFQKSGYPQIIPF